MSSSVSLSESVAAENFQDRPIAVELIESARNEIQQWYDTFYQWSRGLCPREDQYIQPIFKALAEDFRVILTNGEMMDKSEYWFRLKSLHGSREADPASHIYNLSIHSIDDEHVLVYFDLFKQGVAKKKCDSALLRKSTITSTGMEWIYVHESAHELTQAPDFIGDTIQ